MLRSLRYTVEFIAALVGIVIVCGLLFVWRISSAPVTPDFLVGPLEEAVERVVPGSRVHLGKALLTWDGAERALDVRLEEATVTNAEGEVIATVPSTDMKISPWGLLSWPFVPKAVTIDHPQIRLDRDKAGTVSFGGRRLRSLPEESKDEKKGAALVSVLAERFARAVFMKRLSVTRAVIDVRDEETKKTWSLSVPEVFIEHKTGPLLDPGIRFGQLEGRMRIAVVQPKEDASLDVRYTYDAKTQEHRVSSVFGSVIPADIAGGNLSALGFDALAVVAVPLTGTVDFVFDNALTLLTGSMHLHGDEGHLVSEALWTSPCLIKRLDLDVRYDRAKQELSVPSASIDFGGPQLTLSVKGKQAATAPRVLDYTATVALDQLPMNRFAEIWPNSLLPNPRAWLSTNLREGVFEHADISFKGTLSLDDWANPDVQEGHGRIKAVGARVSYLDGVPPLEGVDALATFDLSSMEIAVAGGGIGDLRLLPFTMTILGLSEVDQTLDLPLRVAGPLPDVLTLLNYPPMEYTKALGLAPQDLGGHITGTVTLRFPLLNTLKVKDIQIQATAQAIDLHTSKLVPGVSLKRGSMSLDLDGTGFSLDGFITAGQTPFRVTWKESFEARKNQPLRRIDIVGAVRDNQWAALGVDAFQGTKGPINVLLSVTKPSKNKTILAGTVDMTPAALNVPVLAWQKPAHLPAKATFTATVVPGKPVSVAPIRLEGTRVAAEGRATLSEEGNRLMSFDFETLNVGRTNAALHFEQSTGDKGVLRFEAKGESLDVSGLRGGKDLERDDPRPKEYMLNVNKLYAGAEGFIGQANGFASRDGEGWRAIKLHGMAEGDAPLRLELTPQVDGTRTFLLTSDNFGKAMKGLGFTDTIKGGVLRVTGKSTPEAPRTVVGEAKISAFKIEKLPVLALLLNATSPFGFSDLLSDSASFSRFKSAFTWKGDSITLKHAHAAGSAFGINIDGKVDMNSGSAALEGTLVPFSVVNDILNAIPLIGDLLTGGEDQGVLAVAYEINGTLASPQVSVNPVSLLTPGFIRNLFFQGDDDEDSDDDDD
ncbi:MAG: DUF3971 domain-containing protein [Alphaproteobacteria bacterium]|nr:DUF3971 domain-containing protein [Alphaproteobacteria bacterium]